MVSQEDLRFLGKRRRPARMWNFVGSLLLLALVGLAVTLYLRVPLLIDPFHVGDKLQAKDLDAGRLELMALMLPVVVLLCFIVTAGAIGFGFTAFAHERRYLKIIDSLDARSKRIARSAKPVDDEPEDEPEDEPA